MKIKPRKLVILIRLTINLIKIVFKKGSKDDQNNGKNGRTKKSPADNGR